MLPVMSDLMTVNTFDPKQSGRQMDIREHGDEICMRRARAPRALSAKRVRLVPRGEDEQAIEKPGTAVNVNV